MITDYVILYNGAQRTYRVYIPSGYSYKTPLPLMIVLHDNGSLGISIEHYSGFDQVAEEKNFFVCYPDAINRIWNLNNDNGFIQAILADLKIHYAIDNNKVFVVGMGTDMVQVIARDLYWAIAAFADISHVLSITVRDTLISEPPKPCLFIHGTDDPISPYDGDPYSLSAIETMNFWADKYDENANTNEQSFSLTLDTGNTVSGTIYTKNGVKLFSLTDGGHLFPSNNPTKFSLTTGHTAIKIGSYTTQPAARVIWDYFNGL